MAVLEGFGRLRGASGADRTVMAALVKGPKVRLVVAAFIVAALCAPVLAAT